MDITLQMVTRKKSKKEQSLCPLMEKPWHSVQQRRHFLEMETKNMVVVAWLPPQQKRRKFPSSTQTKLYTRPPRYTPPKQSCIPPRQYLLHPYRVSNPSDRLSSKDNVVYPPSTPSHTYRIVYQPPIPPPKELYTLPRHYLQPNSR
ncbi:hypothetical protein T09_9906 [Trichinella sp. T9]|nr:hypothetical protein T09_9906 [Trichinella sp. T9]